MGTWSGTRFRNGTSPPTMPLCCPLIWYSRSSRPAVSASTPPSTSSAGQTPRGPRPSSVRIFLLFLSRFPTLRADDIRSNSSPTMPRKGSVSCTVSAMKSCARFRYGWKSSDRFVQAFDHSGPLTKSGRWRFRSSGGSSFSRWGVLLAPFGVASFSSNEFREWWRADAVAFAASSTLIFTSPSAAILAASWARSISFMILSASAVLALAALSSSFATGWPTTR
mmetsp:Transcript_34880/g.78593  ORF Transcript_34880/g.78593 Transcript_34880/m.78593 type:complete len:223 (-) Transcript_34880:126-794(-)